jgi:hypothetical protein
MLWNAKARRPKQQKNGIRPTRWKSLGRNRAELIKNMLNTVLTRSTRVALLALALLSVSAAQSSRVVGIIHRSLPPFEFLVYFDNNRGGLAEGAEPIDHIEVRSAGRHIQTIHFAPQDAPIVDGRWVEALSLRDVDCDGYKDLLVRKAAGIHGDDWYYLYRFNRARGVFVAYPRFSSLPLKNVNCGANIVTTYVNSGAAGCAYESGTYHWVDGELLPMRIESQEVTDGGFIRTIRSWSTGTETVVKQIVDAHDCHRPN